MPMKRAFARLLALRRNLVSDNVLDHDYGYVGTNVDEKREPYLIELDDIIEELHQAILDS